MKKRILSLLLAALMVLSIVPVTPVFSVGETETPAAPVPGPAEGGPVAPPAPPANGEPEAISFPTNVFFARRNIKLYAAADDASEAIDFDITQKQGKSMPEPQTVLEAVKTADGKIWYKLDDTNWWSGNNPSNSYKGHPYVHREDVFTADVPEGQQMIQGTAEIPAPTEIDPNATEEMVVAVYGVSVPKKAEVKPVYVNPAEYDGYNISEYPLLNDKYLSFDISVKNNGAEWQPAEGESVTVSLPVSKLGNDGEEVLVLHFHKNNDGTSTYEYIGPLTIKDGSVSFEMTSFSLVVIYNAQATIRIPNIEAFYGAGEETVFTTTNDHFNFIGVYYLKDESDGIVYPHFIMTSDTSKEQAIGSNHKLKEIGLDAYTFSYSEILPSISYDDITKFTSCEVQDENGQVIFTKTDFAGLNKICAIMDIRLPADIQLNESFTFSINGSESGNGWKAGGYVDLDLEYEIIKKVKAGTDASGTFSDSVTVEVGDWVIFQIDVNNIGTMPLSDMIVKDILPDTVFDENTVQVSIDGENGEIGNWVGFSETLFDHYNSDGEFSRKLYVRAQVRTDLTITQSTDYVNTVTMDGMNMPTASSTATVTVLPPKGGVTVKKAVTSENPNVSAPAQDFSFVLTDSQGVKHEFTLANGGEKNFSDLPVGNFTVTETPETGFSTKVNSVSGLTYTGKIENGSSITVSFENQYDTRFASYIIHFVEKGTNTPLHDPVSGSGAEGDTITVSPILIDGYNYDSQTAETITLEVGKIVEAYVYYTKAITSLTIVKEGWANNDPNQTFIFNVSDGNGVNLDVTVHENGSVTIDGLTPGGKYTVTEKNSWSWRYNQIGVSEDTAKTTVAVQSFDAGSADIILNLTGTNQITYVNTRTNQYWLDGDSWCQNIFK